MSSIDTNLNTSPYFDDFDETKNFHRVLFKPSVPVQARELTQLQTILQTQIERFGDNIIKSGSIISGCTFMFDTLQYVKLSDRDTSGNTFTVSDYSNGFFVDASSNLTFQVTLSKAGFEVTNPNLQTIVGSYINSGNNTIDTFEQGKTLKFYPANGQISNTFTISSGGLGYTNGDLLQFISDSGTGASANVTTNTTGGITAVNLISAGSRYRWDGVPVINVVTSTGSSANIIAQINSSASFTVANNSFETGNTLFNVVGSVATLKISDGIIYQKGHFIRVNSQRVIVKDYDAVPNGYSVGFITEEALVDYSKDTSLLDNASGFNNENAPGADRLKLTPVLVSNTTTNASVSNNFFTIVRYENGFPVEIKPTTEYSKIGDAMAQRTYEESGDYVTKLFSLNSETKEGNTTYLDIKVGAGIAYVKGYRNQTIGTSTVPIRKGNDYANVDSGSISQTIGNYVFVDEMLGTIPFNTAVEVKILGTATNRISTTPAGSDPTVPSAANSTHFSGTSPSYTGAIVGTANIRSIRYESGTPGTPAGKYRMYLFNVKMNAGKNFADAKAIAYNGEGIADIVLENSKAVLKETNNKVFINRIGQKAIKTLDHKSTSQATYFYRTSNTTTLQANGSGTVTLTGTRVFDYTASGYLSEEQERELIIVTGNATAQTQPLTGTVTVSSGANTVTGSTSDFTSEYVVGDWIKVAGATNGEQRITGITNTTHLTVATDFGSSVSGAAHRRYFPADVPINLFDSAASNAEVSSTQKILTINASRGQTLESTLDVNVYFNVKQTQAQQKTKTLGANTYVKIDCSNNAATSSGPWSLGLPDVFDIQKVYVHTTFTGIEGTTYDKTSNFQLINNQQDGFYGLSQLKLKSTSTLTIGASDKILVVVRPFTTSGSSGLGYFSVDSYPVDDATIPTPVNAITTQQIPTYVSPTLGEAYDLRDSIDFRPYATATATYATSAASATTNPGTTISFSGEQYLSTPNKTNNIDYQYYLPRIDALYMSKKGKLTIVEGISEAEPNPPRVPEDGMDMAVISVAPYPTLSTTGAKQAGRPDYQVTITNKQLVRYTMKDIKAVDKRIQRIEYYTSLNLLEKQAADLQIPSSADATKNRFKNGILVDNFKNFNVGSLIDREFKAGRDVGFNQLTPRNRQFNIDLQSSTLTNTVKTGNLITLPYNHVEFKSQTGATRTRNCAEFFWKWSGTCVLLPDYDNYFDVKTPPDKAINVGLDLGASTKALISELNQIEAIQRPKSEVLSSTYDSVLLGTSTSITNRRTVRATSGSGFDLQENADEVTVETYSDTRTDLIQDSITQITYDEVENTIPVGSFVTDLTSSPYIREQEIEVYCYGLKPDTRHYVYFDEKDHSSYVTPCAIEAGEQVQQGSFADRGVRGGSIITNSSGECFFKLYIPAQTYKVGDRQVLVSEKNLYTNIDASRSFCTQDFSAYNFGVTKSAVTLTTKEIKAKQNVVNTGQRVVSETSTSQKTSLKSITTRRWNEPPAQESDGGNSNGDPLSQTFRVNLAKNEIASGVFVTKMDLFFETRDPRLGITVELREVNNGYPAPNILPYAQIHLASSQVNLSTNGSVATTVTFDAPVYLPTEKEFCVVLLPDGNNPNYNVFVRKTGENDLRTNVPNINDNFLGSLFLSTNNTAWKPVIDEDLKFILYRAEFSSESGTAEFVEKDYEFIDMANINGRFETGELAFVYNNSANVTGTVSFSTSNNFITGTGTSFSSELVVGDTIALTNGTSHDIRQVIAIANNTSLKVRGYPKFTDTTANIQKTPVGKVVFFENTSANNDLFLIDSTASNTTFKFASGNQVIGSRSGANCTINAVENVDITSFENLIYSFTPNETLLSQAATVNTASGSIASTGYPMNNRNYLSTAGKLNSKSNQIVSGKSFRPSFTLTTGNRIVSPVIDASTMGIVRYHNIINNDSTNEYLPGQGSADAKYVSKVVTLDSELDAEDMRLYVTSTKPPGSQLEVFIKGSNALESDSFIDRQWTKLELQGDDSFTNPYNRVDYREYEYRIPQTPPTSSLDGYATVTSGSATVTSTVDHDTAGDLAVGDLLKVVNTSRLSDYQIEAITSISGTTITLGNSLSFTNSQCSLEKVTQKQTLFKDPQNDYIATYYNSDTIKFDTFKYYQVKIVMLATDKALVPRVDNYRAIALSI